MRRQDLLDWIRKQPFEPFVMELSTGERFNVRNPELLWVGRSRCHLGLFDRDILERTVDISLLHIVKIEPVNGRRRKGTRRSTKK